MTQKTIDDTKQAAISFNALRQTIGYLGLFLPLGLYAGNRLFSDCGCLQDSISHYYYTRMGVLLVSILTLLGAVLIFYPAYKEEKKGDSLLTTLSGIAALCVAYFPTFANSENSCALFNLPQTEWRNYVHFASAGLMLLLFSWMSIFLFTRSTINKKSDRWRAPKNKQKRIRNRIFIACGIITALSVITLAVITYLDKHHKVRICSKYTFWFEVAALVPFGISWLVKGGFVLTDKGENSSIRHFGKMIGIVKEEKGM